MKKTKRDLETIREKELANYASKKNTLTIKYLNALKAEMDAHNAKNETLLAEYMESMKVEEKKHLNFLENITSELFELANESD